MHVLYCPFPDEDAAKRVVRKMLDDKLIICGNILPSSSLYLWQGAIEEKEETIVLFKTTQELCARAQSQLEEIHPYDVPCIFTFRVDANEQYADWARKELTEK